MAISVPWSEFLLVHPSKYKAMFLFAAPLCISIPATWAEWEISLLFCHSHQSITLSQGIMISVLSLILIKSPERICCFLKLQHEALFQIAHSVHCEMHALICLFQWYYFKINILRWDRWEWWSTSMENMKSWRLL